MTISPIRFIRASRRSVPTRTVATLPRLAVLGGGGAPAWPGRRRPEGGAGGAATAAAAASASAATATAAAAAGATGATSAEATSLTARARARTSSTSASSPAAIQKVTAPSTSPDSIRSAGGSLLMRSPMRLELLDDHEGADGRELAALLERTSTRSTASPRSWASAHDHPVVVGERPRRRRPGGAWRRPRRRRAARRGVAGGDAVEAGQHGGGVDAPRPTPAATRSTISWRVSRQANRASVMAGVTGAPSSRIAASTSSIRCVRRAIASKPIVALIPLRECATRKITVSGSGSEGSRSRSSSEAFSAWRLSRLSSRKRPRYSEVSTA